MLKTFRKLVSKHRRTMVALGAAVFVLFVGFSFLSNANTLHRQAEDLAALQQKLADAKLVNEDLARVLDYTKTDAWIEQAAREQFGFLKPGEIRFSETK